MRLQDRIRAAVERLWVYERPDFVGLCSDGYRWFGSVDQDCVLKSTWGLRTFKDASDVESFFGKHRMREALLNETKTEITRLEAKYRDLIEELGL